MVVCVCLTDHHSVPVCVCVYVQIAFQIYAGEDHVVVPSRPVSRCHSAGSSSSARGGSSGGGASSSSVSYREVDLWSTDPWVMLTRWGWGFWDGNTHVHHSYVYEWSTDPWVILAKWGVGMATKSIIE